MAWRMLVPYRLPPTLGMSQADGHLHILIADFDLRGNRFALHGFVGQLEGENQDDVRHLHLWLAWDSVVNHVAVCYRCCWHS